MAKRVKWVIFSLVILVFNSCGQPGTEVLSETTRDTVQTNQGTADSGRQAQGTDRTEVTREEKPDKTVTNEENPAVLVYNFHVTNRCVSCIAIEEATTKTLNTYFAMEVKQGRIRRQILNVDDEANKAISEKYQAFGSGLFVTRLMKGKETTTDLTGDGFRFAKNKEDKFIEILKNQITQYLKP